MKNYIIGLILVISPFMALCHNALSAKYQLDAGEKVSLLTINLSQDGVNLALSKKYGSDVFNGFSQSELEAKIVDYVKSNFSLLIDKKEIKLKEGGIKLGGHQTDLKFVLPPISKDMGKMVISIPAFKENENHQSIFYHNLKGGSAHIILSSQNNYESSVILRSSPYAIPWVWISGIALIVLGTVLFMKRRHSPMNIQPAM